jgi:hypothetical protein
LAIAATQHILNGSNAVRNERLLPFGFPTLTRHAKPLAYYLAAPPVFDFFEMCHPYFELQIIVK